MHFCRKILEMNHMRFALLKIVHCELRVNHTFFDHLQKHIIICQKVRVLSTLVSKSNRFIDEPNFFNEKMCLNNIFQTRQFAKKGGGKKMKGSKSIAVLSDEELMEVFDVHAYRNQQQSVLEKLKADFVAHLSVHTSSGSIYTLPVKIGDEEFPLNELAQLSRKNPTLIVINMSSFPEGLKPTLEAIANSGLGYNPQQEGTTIYLSIPKVTREFREQLAKNAKTLFVKAKDEIRYIQNLHIKEVKSKTELSEDLVFSAQQYIKETADSYAAEAEKLMKAKQQDLLGNS